MNIATLLEMAADAFPDRTAVVAGSTRLSYGELLQASRAAAKVIADSGAGYMAMLDVNSVATPVGLFGAALAGVPYTPLNYRLTDAELDALATRLPGALFVAGEDALARVDAPDDVRMIGRQAFLDALSAGGAPAAGDEDEDRVAVQLFTSGTTGAPKAAILRHDNLMAYILGTVEFASADEDEANLVTVPPYHVAAVSAILSSTYSCRRMVVMEAFDPQAWLDLCQSERITTGFVVPTMLTRIMDQIDAHPGRWDVSSLRAIRFGGGKMPVSIIGKAMELMPHVDFTNAYGMTETSSTICLLDPESHRAARSSDDPAIRRRLGSVGRPVGDIEIQVRDEAGNILPADAPGQVYVRGAQVAGEYSGKGRLLDADGWFATRDNGFLDADGFLFVDGRADDVIVRGGENISPGEIEDVLLAHPAIAEAAVVSVPDEEWGEAIGAVVVARPDTAVTADDLRSWVRDRLRSSRVPSLVEFRAGLPYSDVGKILRRVLRDEMRAR
jgi:acyl-CoA synthetase (AMP-forming)/AMP-acid ligase II